MPHLIFPALLFLLVASCTGGSLYSKKIDADREVALAKERHQLILAQEELFLKRLEIVAKAGVATERSAEDADHLEEPLETERER